jgi:hypothetical protein
MSLSTPSQATGVSYGNGAVAAYGYNDARGFLTGVAVTNGAATP